MLNATRNGYEQEISNILSYVPSIMLKEEYAKELEKLMNVIGSNGWNALHFACYMGYNSIVTLFIGKGANLNKPSLEGWTAL